MQLLGENSILCSRLMGEKPMYIWLPMCPIEKASSLMGMRRKNKGPALGDVEHIPELQVV